MARRIPGEARSTPGARPRRGGDRTTLWCSSRVVQVIARLLQRGVVLGMGSDEVRARSADSLRASLAVHCCVATARLAELGNMSDRALNAQAAALDALSMQLSTDLKTDGPAPATVLARVQQQDTPLPDSWADAVATARGWDDGQDVFQRAVLEALVEYLGRERACVRILIANRERAASARDEDDEPTRQKLVLDPGALAQNDRPAHGFERIPKGDPREVIMAAGQALEIMLAQHRFLLVSGTPWLLVDDVGEDLRLQPGRSVVGRSADCEAMVHESYRAISRRHVVLEIQGTGSVRITDVSSLGTFLPAHGAHAAEGGRVH